MGGKRKQAQRTKNNTRPSSSGRSAELLGTALPPFVGFSSVKETALVSSGFSLASDDLDTLIDSNFQLIFKKMNKKDSTTKLKALQEFTDLVKASEVEAIKAILPFWPRLYCALVIDSEHKVREATQLAHHQLVLKARRNIAPYLKQLVGTWFISQYDTYAPAASAASRAFEDCFPYNKAQEAIVFCQEEILTYICDNLTTQTPQTISSTKVQPSEDSEAKYQRVIISSLSSYALYLSKIPMDQIEKYNELNLKIISNSKFWKLGRNKIPPIRSAWFAVLTMICQKAPFLMEKEAAHIVGFVFANLDEKEPTVLPSVWEAALSILSLMNEWWNYVNIDKLFIPKLNKLLRDGGNGNASVIFPNLLPVLSHLPSIIDVNSFYPLFFENMRVGLKTKNVLGSRSESQAVSVAFIECLQYIIMKNQTDAGLCEKLIKTQLFPLLEWSFNDTQACFKSLYNQVAKLVQFWDRNAKDYGKYLAYYWHNLESLFLGLLLNLTQSCEVTPTQLATRQIELILSLKHVTKCKQHLKVSFNTEEQPTKKQDTLSNFSESYWNALNQLVYKTCEAYVKLINDKRSKDLIEHLVCLIHNFDSYTLFQQFNSGKESNFCDIYRELLLPWLIDDVLCSKAVVDLLFLLFKYFNDDEKTEVLGGFCNNLNEECFGWCVAQTLSHPNCEDPIILKWLCSKNVSVFLVTIAEKELNSNSTSELNLVLKQAFAEKDENDLMISKEAVLDIIKVLTRPLLDPLTYSTRLDVCSSFAAYTSTAIYTPHFKLKYGDDLLLALFTLANSVVSDEILSTDTYWEINTGWQDVIVVLSQETPYSEFKEVAEKCIAVILKSHTEKSLDLINNFIQIVAKYSPLWLKDILFLFFKHDFIDEWRNDICNMCEHAEYIRGRLSIEHDAINESTKINENNVKKYFEWMDLIVSVITKPLEDDSKEFFDHIVDLLQHECDVFILDLFSSFTLGEILRRNYPCTTPVQNIKEILNAFQKKLHTLVTNLDHDYLHSIETLLFKQLCKGEWLWTTCLYDFYVQSGIEGTNTIINLINQIACTERRLLLIHTTHTWAKHITYDQIWKNGTPLETVTVLRSMIFKPELEIKIAQAFTLIDCIKRKNQKEFIVNSNLDGIIVEFIIEIIRLFSGILQYQSECVQLNRWDLILTSFVTWCGNVTKLLSNEVQTKSLILALSELFDSVNSYVQKCDNKSIAKEWDDVFAQDVNSNFLQIWCYYTDYYQKQPDQCLVTDIPFIQDFGKTISNLDTKYIFSKSCSVEWSKLLQQACACLTHPVMPIQLWGYHMLMKLIPGLAEIDANSVTNTPNANGLIIERFKSHLLTTQEVVQSMLLEFRLAEDSCRVQPFTDSYTYTLAYLLLWDVLINLCEQSSAELRYQYSDWFRRQNFVHYLLMNLFKLMPLEMEVKTKPFSDWFVTKCAVTFTEEPTSQLIERLVCWVYTETLTQLPVLVRQWWCNQDTRVGQLVERITSTFVSTHLCNQELADLTNHVHKFKNMTIKTHPTVREVIAVYTVDEVQMELIITLPHNYPLFGPDVHCNKQILGTSQKLWLMQLKMCVLHQDGRIWDGLLLWNNNLDKRFDGVEECYICFAVIHQGTYQIPKLTCQTCKKKFHSACLYKWFSTSNKSSCPVCRNLF